MVNYKKMYFLLFNKITDALAALRKFNYGEAVGILQTAQIEAEEMYIDGGDGLHSP